MSTLVPQEDRFWPGRADQRVMVAAAELAMPVISGPFQGLAGLDAWTYADLKRDIQENGVLVSVVVTQDGVIVDGHHRWQIAQELGITESVPVEVRTFLSDSAAEAEAISLNVNRRQMSKAERDRNVTRMRQLGMTQKQIGERLSISQGRVAQIEESPEVLVTNTSGDSPPKKRGGKYATRADSEKVQARVAEMALAGATTKQIPEALDLSYNAAWERRRQVAAAGNDRPAEPPLHEQIAECAKRGMTSKQIANAVGLHEQTVRVKARAHGIDIPADRASHKKSIDADAAMTRAVGGVADALYAFKHIPMSDLDAEQVHEWSRSLDESAKSIRTLIRQLNQLTKEQDQL